MPIKILFMLFLVFFALDLVVVEGTHFKTIFVHVCFDISILYMVLDDIL